MDTNMFVEHMGEHPFWGNFCAVFKISERCIDLLVGWQDPSDGAGSALC